MATSTFLTLPAELRNQIYTEIFHTTYSARIDLLDAAAPSGDILLTCRQIHAEVSAMHKAFCAIYWQKNDFFIDTWVTTEDDKARLRRRQMSEIQHLDLVMHAAFPPNEHEEIRTATSCYTLLSKIGLWRGSIVLDGDIVRSVEYHVLSPGSTRVFWKDVGPVETAVRVFGDREVGEAFCERLEEHVSLNAQVLHLLERSKGACTRHGLVMMRCPH